MRVPQSYIQKCKVVAHVFQALLIFIAGCITLAVMTKGGGTGGATKFYFALCFLTGPALVYLTMTPMWSRAARFANAYAFIALDGLYTILWLAAFAAIAFYNSAGIKQGAKDKKIPDGNGNCTTFAYGSESKCTLSRATFGFGVVIFILFAITTAISAYYAMKFRKEGVMPYESNKANPHHLGGENAKDNAWSTEIDHHDSDDDDRHTERGGNQEEDEYALLHSTETDEGRHPGRPLSWGEDNRYGRDPAAPYAAYDDHTNALSPTAGGYEEYRHSAVSHQGYEEYRSQTAGAHAPSSQPGYPTDNGGIPTPTATGPGGYSFSR